MNMLKTSLLIAVLTALFLGAGLLIGGESGLLIAGIIAAGVNFMAWWNSDKLAIRQARAQLVTRQSNPDLVGLVERLARKASLPTPAVYLSPSNQPNAFATGRNPENAAVAVTRGLLRHLNRNEIAGVVAHELAHIKNRDTLIMTLTATFSGALSMLGNFFFFFRSGNRNALTVIVAMILAPLAAAIIQFAISRTREYAADNLGARITGKPLALASALKKIDRLAQKTAPAASNPAFAHLYIRNPFSAGGIAQLFSTHPPTRSRIDALEALAEDMNLHSRPQDIRIKPGRSLIPRSGH